MTVTKEELLQRVTKIDKNLSDEDFYKQLWDIAETYQFHYEDYSLCDLTRDILTEEDIVEKIREYWENGWNLQDILNYFYKLNTQTPRDNFKKIYLSDEENEITSLERLERDYLEVLQKKFIEILTQSIEAEKEIKSKELTKQELIKRLEAIDFKKPNTDLYKDFVQIARDYEEKFQSSCLIYIIDYYVFTTASGFYIEEILLRKYHNFGLLGVKSFVEGFDSEEEVYSLDGSENLMPAYEDNWKSLKEAFLEILNKKENK